MAAKALACAEPLMILCIAIDGADQSAFATPYFCQETKESVRGWKLKMKLIGALVENKNRFFLAYLHLLVKFGVFDVIELHFGLKGHTHDEIDQVFSRVSVALRKHDAATRKLLGIGILEAYKFGCPNFQVFLEHLHNLGNVRDLVKDDLFPVYSLRTPQAYKVAKDPADGEVKMQVQARSYNEDWGVISRNGEYGPGWMTIMKRWPDLRDTPDHPRKALPDHTLHQHRVCIEAAGPRIKNSCRNIGVLPEGETAEGLYESRMQELAESVVELGESSSLPFDWKLDLYGQGGALPTGDRDEGVGSQAAGMGTSTTREGGEATGLPTSSVTPAPSPVVFRVEVGEFVALPTPPALKESVSVGKVLSVEAGDGGDELELRWYMPARVPPNCPRSKYGKGRCVEEFHREQGKLVPSVGMENVAAVSSKFRSLTAGGKLPAHVWASVAESTAPSTDEDDEGEEEEEEEEGGVSAPQGLMSGVHGEGLGIAGSGVESDELALLPEAPSSALVALTRAMPPPNVRITAAFHRPRRSTQESQQ
eukprot:g10755.t1